MPPIEVKPDELKWNDAGLIPAIVQDVATENVLMLAYMNRESLRLTLETGQTWFYSRSRQLLWHKGATSGNVQDVVEIKADCDRDTLLVRVHQRGTGACHEGPWTCFNYPLRANGK